MIGQERGDRIRAMGREERVEEYVCRGADIKKEVDEDLRRHLNLIVKRPQPSCVNSS